MERLLADDIAQCTDLLSLLGSGHAHSLLHGFLRRQQQEGAHEDFRILIPQLLILPQLLLHLRAGLAGPQVKAQQDVLALDEVFLQHLAGICPKRFSCLASFV